MRISDWSSDVCSSDLYGSHEFQVDAAPLARPEDRLKPADKRPWHARRHFDGLILGTKGGDEAFKLLTAAKQRQPRPQQCRGQPVGRAPPTRIQRSEEHTSELQSLMRISYAVFCLKKTKI